MQLISSGNRIIICIQLSGVPVTSAPVNRPQNSSCSCPFSTHKFRWWNLHQTNESSSSSLTCLGHVLQMIAELSFITHTSYSSSHHIYLSNEFHFHQFNKRDFQIFSHHVRFNGKKNRRKNVTWHGMKISSCNLSCQNSEPESFRKNLHIQMNYNKKFMDCRLLHLLFCFCDLFSIFIFFQVVFHGKRGQNSDIETDVNVKYMTHRERTLSIMFFNLNLECCTGVWEGANHDFTQFVIERGCGSENCEFPWKSCFALIWCFNLCILMRFSI